MTLNKKCNSCEKEFICQGSDTDISCWCDLYPKELILENNIACLCTSCLSSSISQKIIRLIAENNHEELLRIAGIFRDEIRLFLDIDYTIENGKYVFTKWYLLKRGFCCRSGCRNCPYPKENERRETKDVRRETKDVKRETRDERRERWEGVRGRRGAERLRD